MLRREGVEGLVGGGGGGRKLDWTREKKAVKVIAVPGIVVTPTRRTESCAEGIGSRQCSVCLWRVKVYDISCSCHN